MLKQSEENLTQEQIYKIDLFILNILKEGLLGQNIDFIDVMDYFDDQVIMDLNCSKEIFQRRTMYNFGLGYLTLKEINNEITEEDFLYNIINKCKKRGIDYVNFFSNGDNGKKNLDKKIYYSNFLEAKITAEGLKYIEDLERQIDEMKGLGLVANKFKKIGEIFLKMKVVTGIGLTIFCIIIIFIFDTKVSEFVKKIPLLNSVINTNVLETFENVNENDEFYQNMSIQMKKIDPGILRTLKDIKVKNISNNEKIFKITLLNGQEKFVSVIRDTVGKIQTQTPFDGIE